MSLQFQGITYIYGPASRVKEEIRRGANRYSAGDKLQMTGLVVEKDSFPGPMQEYVDRLRENLKTLGRHPSEIELEVDRHFKIQGMDADDYRQACATILTDDDFRQCSEQKAGLPPDERLRFLYLSRGLHGVVPSAFKTGDMAAQNILREYKARFPGDTDFARAMLAYAREAIDRAMTAMITGSPVRSEAIAMLAWNPKAQEFEKTEIK